MKRSLIALNLLFAVAVLLLVPCSFATEAPHPAPSLGPAPAVAAPNLSSPQTPQATPATIGQILGIPASTSPLQFQCAQLPPNCCIAWNGHCHYCTGYNCELP
jgi:hypothetical protein